MSANTNSDMSSPVMYIFVNSDLKMRKGRMAAQVAHIVQSITEEIVRDMYERTPPPDYCLTYMTWTKKATVIILQATETQLNELRLQPEARAFLDEIPSSNGDKELTVVGLFPTTKVQFNDHKLV